MSRFLEVSVGYSPYEGIARPEVWCKQKSEEQNSFSITTAGRRRGGEMKGWPDISQHNDKHLLDLGVTRKDIEHYFKFLVFRIKF